MEEQKYLIFIQWSDEDQGFVTSVPDLPGCMSFGETKEQALTNTYDAIHAWIEVAREFGREVPRPTTTIGAA